MPVVAVVLCAAAFAFCIRSCREWIEACFPGGCVRSSASCACHLADFTMHLK